MHYSVSDTGILKKKKKEIGVIPRGDPLQAKDNFFSPCYKIIL